MNSCCWMSVMSPSLASHRFNSLKPIIYCMMMLLVGTNTQVFATTKTWNSTTAGGLWTTTGNWSGGTPTTGDDVVINNGGTGFNITAVPAISLHSLIIGGAGTSAITLTAAATGNLLTIATSGTFSVNNSLTTSGLNITLSSGVTAAVAAAKSFQFDKTITNNSTLTVSGTLILSTAAAAISTNAATWVSGATLQYGNADVTTLTTTVKEWPASSGPDNVIIKTTGTITLNAPKTLAGSLTITEGTLADGGNILTGNSTSANSFTIANGAAYTTTRITTPWLPTYSAPAIITFGAGSTIIYSGNGSFALPTPPATYGNLVIGGTGTKTVNDAPLTTAGNLTLANNTSAILLLNYGLSIGGTITGGASATLDVEDGGGAPALTLPAITNNLGKLIINRTAGITLGAPLSLAGIAGSGALALTNGVLTTTSSNLLTISYAFTSAISGGSASSFVNGPIFLSLSTNYTAGGAFTFPFGDASGPYYTPLQLAEERNK